MPCVARFATSRFAVQRAFGCCANIGVLSDVFTVARDFSLTGHRTPACNAGQLFAIESASDMGFERIFSESRPVAFGDLTAARTCASHHPSSAAGGEACAPQFAGRKKPFSHRWMSARIRATTKKQRHGAQMRTAAAMACRDAAPNIRDQYRGSPFAGVQLPWGRNPPRGNAWHNTRQSAILSTGVYGALLSPRACRGGAGRYTGADQRTVHQSK